MDGRLNNNISKAALEDKNVIWNNSAKCFEKLGAGKFFFYKLVDGVETRFDYNKTDKLFHSVNNQSHTINGSNLARKLHRNVNGIDKSFSFSSFGDNREQFFTCENDDSLTINLINGESFVWADETWQESGKQEIKTRATNDLLSSMTNVFKNVMKPFLGENSISCENGAFVFSQENALESYTRNYLRQGLDLDDFNKSLKIAYNEVLKLDNNTNVDVVLFLQNINKSMDLFKNAAPLPPSKNIKDNIKKSVDTILKSNEVLKDIEFKIDDNGGIVVDEEKFIKKELGIAKYGHVEAFKDVFSKIKTKLTNLVINCSGESIEPFVENIINNCDSILDRYNGMQRVISNEYNFLECKKRLLNRLLMTEEMEKIKKNVLITGMGNVDIVAGDLNDDVKRLYPKLVDQIQAIMLYYKIEEECRVFSDNSKSCEKRTKNLILSFSKQQEQQIQTHPKVNQPGQEVDPQSQQHTKQPVDLLTRQKPNAILPQDKEPTTIKALPDKQIKTLNKIDSVVEESSAQNPQSQQNRVELPSNVGAFQKSAFFEPEMEQPKSEQPKSKNTIKSESQEEQSRIKHKKRTSKLKTESQIRTEEVIPANNTINITINMGIIGDVNILQFIVPDNIEDQSSNIYTQIKPIREGIIEGNNFIKSLVLNEKINMEALSCIGKIEGFSGNEPMVTDNNVENFFESIKKDYEEIEGKQGKGAELSPIIALKLNGLVSENNRKNKKETTLLKQETEYYKKIKQSPELKPYVSGFFGNGLKVKEAQKYSDGIIDGLNGNVTRLNKLIKDKKKLIEVDLEKINGLKRDYNTQVEPTQKHKHKRIEGGETHVKQTQKRQRTVH
ncbi:MAG: hypothetical protein LBC92_02930 [Rickettsiales bacterium]|jgi:hypothetical protein|nr:hypothetical protein [Rickettsiales bacterium]